MPNIFDAFYFLLFFLQRKMRDSNPRYPVMGIPDFESSAFGHSANLPSKALPCCEGRDMDLLMLFS